MFTPLSPEAIRRGLVSRSVGHRVVCLGSVGSTNDWLKAAAAEGAPEGLAVFAEEQTVGRGQIGHRWLAPIGCCLLGSVLFRPPFPPERLFALTMLGACAAAGAAIELTGLPVQLKWPNDLISERGKLGGVLTESSSLAGQVEYAILGIGINVNLSRRALSAIPGAASLQAELGHRVNRNQLARALLRGIDERYTLLCQGQFAAVFSEWRERLATIGKWVDLRRGPKVEGPCFALQVTDDGGLILERPDGTTFTAFAGEVSVRTTNGQETQAACSQ
ncbi:MAG: biotin--[acetyl-CoA-carboxylase] ligase [Chloroflexota bacterium]